MLENNFNSKILKLQSNAVYNSSVDKQCEEAIPDTGASTHFLKKEAIKNCTKIKQQNDGTQATAADGGKMKATHKIVVPLAPELSEKATTGYILDNLETGSLVSIAQLCDDDCIALFTKYDIKIIKMEKQSLKVCETTRMGFGASL